MRVASLPWFLAVIACQPPVDPSVDDTDGVGEPVVEADEEQESDEPLDPLACIERDAPVGAAPNTNALMPGSQRLRAATSPDGMNWTRRTETIIDQAATPTLALAADGRPLLYMTAHKPDGQRDGFTVSIGSADGTTWKHCNVETHQFSAQVSGSDPDIVTLPGGGYRVFLTGTADASQNPPLVGIHYADSGDGIHWMYGGIALSRVGSPTLDSMTFLSGSTWHMYALDAQSVAMVHATSSDGKTFAAVDTAERKIGDEPYVLSQAAQVGETLRIYGFGPRGEEIRSFTTANGSDLTPDTTLLLSIEGAPPEESEFVKDPSITRLTDGTYLMVYSTVIP